MTVTYFTCDDISARHRGHLRKLERLREEISGFRVTCFVIAGDLDSDLVRWLQRDWIEVGVHGCDHGWPPECEREDRADRIRTALSILSPLLPERYGFRAPGFQMTGTTYPILRELGFWYIAHQTRIQPLKRAEIFEQGLLTNSHISENVEVRMRNGEFRLISEGFDNHPGTVPGRPAAGDAG